VSDSQAQNVSPDNMLGQRLKVLRGVLSQEAFAERIGVSRAALANYETGRTKPGREVLKKVSEVSGVPLEHLETGAPVSPSELAAALGFTPGGPDTITDHELALVRLLRLCRPSTILEVAKAIQTGIVENDEPKGLADPLTVVHDLKQLVTIIEREGDYNRGVSRAGFDQIITYLRKKSGKD
jgi:transcriptional regulator with XRE-family HTH domain